MIHVDSLSGQTPLQPTGTAARPRRPRGGLQSVGGVCVLPGQALPPPTGTAANPEGYAAASNRAGLGALALALPPHSAWEYAESVGASG